MSTATKEIPNIKQIILDKNKELKDRYKKALSVSRLNEYLKTKFDKEAQAHKCYLKGLEDPTYKYAGMTEEAILEAWDQKANISKHYGSLLDDFTGLYLEEQDDQLLSDWKDTYNFENDTRLKNTCTGVIQFYRDITEKTNYRFVLREIPLYCESDSGNKINGRLDCLLYNPDTDSYIIIDWKTTEKITTESYRHSKYLLGPAYTLEECDMNLYTIQLHVYKKSLVETYKLAPYSRISVYVCNLLREPENGKYYKLFPQNFEFNNNRINAFINYGNLQLKLSRICKNEEKETVNE